MHNAPTAWIQDNSQPRQQARLTTDFKSQLVVLVCLIVEGDLGPDCDGGESSGSIKQSNQASGKREAVVWKEGEGRKGSVGARRSAQYNERPTIVEWAKVWRHASSRLRQREAVHAATTLHRWVVKTERNASTRCVCVCVLGGRGRW